MKFRKDFVTNSSSSSFVCDVCGNVESGWDMCIEEAEMVECENGHEICQYHIEPDMEKLKDDYCKKEFTAMFNEDDDLYNKFKEEDESKEDCLTRLLEDDVDEIIRYVDTYDLYYNLPAEFCPICNHDVVKDSEVIDFATQKLGVTREELDKLTREYLIERDSKK